MIVGSDNHREENPKRSRASRSLPNTALAVWLAGTIAFAVLPASAAAGLNEVAKLEASDGGPLDSLGTAVSIDEDTAVAGAYLDDDTGFDSGSAYVFFFDGETWTQEAKLTASDAASEDLFGRAVSISADVVVVGAALDDDRGEDSGAAYVFRHDGTDWAQEAKLTASDGDEFDLFGEAVSIDHETILIGALGENRLAGAAYVFRYDGASWVQEAKLTASDGAEGNFFGRSVAVSTGTAVIGAHDPSGAGAAYVFRIDGTTWVEDAKLTASDAAQGDLFGRSVAVAGDVAVVGARGNDDDGNESGSAYVFLYDGSLWLEDSKLRASDGTAGDGFGSAVAVGGGTAVIGSSESAYVFGDDGTTWVEEAKLASSDGGEGDLFGSAVDVSNDTALVGAPRSGLAGAAYVFLVPEPSAWVRNAGALAVLAGLARRRRRAPTGEIRPRSSALAASW